MTQILDVELPKKLGFIFKPARYKVLYGGRGGAKSWGVATALLILGMKRKMRILCARELQSSIRDSVHKLLSDRIFDLNLAPFYNIQQATIKGANGTEFLFEGLKHNVSKIKSYEGVDICWVEEAHLVSNSSWATLIPTIRKDGSEIWITFNPELEDDETYQRFVVNPPDSAVVQKVNWDDNPWFPDVLRAEKDELKQRDPDAYLNVWEGECRQMLEGAIYAEELRAAAQEDRITKVPYSAKYPVSTYWDLGYSDSTSIWFAQKVGYEVRIIDFYQNNLKKLQHYIQTLKDKPYIYETAYLPHDAKETRINTQNTVEGIMKAHNFKTRIVPRTSIVNGINAVRTLFPSIVFDQGKCADGLHALRHYRFEYDQETGRYSKTPLHDWASHPADAFKYLAISYQQPKKAKKQLYPELNIA